MGKEKIKVHFTKMEGTGNDFLIFNAVEGHSPNSLKVISGIEQHAGPVAQALCDRHFGIGGDGIIIVSLSSRAEFRMRIFNSDGSEARMCGNGIRCVGKYLFDRGVCRKESILVESNSGNKALELSIAHDVVKSVRVDMGEPALECERIPVLSDKPKLINEPINIGGYSLRMTCVNMGNPHAVFFVDHITDDMVRILGPQIETHPMFPDRANVEFIEVLSPAEVRMRVWERGAGETLACGTGASAIPVAGSLNGLTERKLLIHLLGGDLILDWAKDNRVYKTGPASIVFDGAVDLLLPA